MTQKIIGLCGARNAGKDAVAGILAARFGVKQISFGEPIYQEVSKAFGVPVSLLAKRETKETALPELALINCTDYRFVLTVVNEAGKAPTHGFLVEPKSPREILQLWGTEYRRKQFGADYWIRQVERTLQDNPAQDFCISDVRLLREVEVIERAGGQMWRVRRPGQEVVDGRNAHASESELANFEAGVVIENVGSLDDLSSAVVVQMSCPCARKLGLR